MRSVGILACLLLSSSLLGSAHAADEAKKEGEGTWAPAPAVPVEMAPAERPYRTGGVLGLGPSIGSRSGLSLKIWPKPMHGLVLDVGGTPFANSFAFAFGYRLHPKPLRFAGGWAVHGYFGPGFRMRVAIGADTQGATTAVPLLGLHVPIGLSLTREGLPVEIYAEVGPGFDFWSAFSVDADAVIGLRFYPPASVRKPTPARPPPPTPTPTPTPTPPPVSDDAAGR